MLTLISLLVVLVGCANWLTIGLLQFDFIAGLFGSQSNVFSRIIYVLVGVAAAILVINLIKNKGKVTFNLKKMKKEKQPALAPAESGKDYSKQNTEAGKDYSKEDSYHHYPNPPQNTEMYYSNTNEYSQNQHSEFGEDYSARNYKEQNYENRHYNENERKY